MNSCAPPQALCCRPLPRAGIPYPPFEVFWQLNLDSPCKAHYDNLCAIFTEEKHSHARLMKQRRSGPAVNSLGGVPPLLGVPFTSKRSNSYG